ncbi:uncharacterized protein AKAME5_002386800 [Lates japonicus]|uniref:Uncharacterized protein n=1 Tax=Lates japonicus TaxID=270547 RepID=A0AAD3RKK3_LATJO|nr:uncharacterized protein AKAME5_002386800 [Lates japonicus]
MVVAPKVLLQKAGDLLIDNDSCPISPSLEIHNLGFFLEPTLSFLAHIKSVTKSAIFHLKNTSRLQPPLTDSIAETLIHAFVTTCLDYCNGVLFGISSKALDTQLLGFLHTQSPGSTSPHPHPSPLTPG